MSEADLLNSEYDNTARDILLTRIAELEADLKHWKEEAMMLSRDKSDYGNRIAELEAENNEFRRRWANFLRMPSNPDDLLSELDRENILLKERIAQLKKGNAD